MEAAVLGLEENPEELELVAFSAGAGLEQEPVGALPFGALPSLEPGKPWLGTGVLGPEVHHPGFHAHACQGAHFHFCSLPGKPWLGCSGIWSWVPLGSIKATLLVLPAASLSSVPLNSPPALGQLPPDTSFCLLFSMAAMARLWASSSFATGPETVKDLPLLALPLTLALHFLFSQISCRSSAVRVPDTTMGQ